MSNRIIRVFPDAETLNKAAAREFVRCAGESVAARGRFIVSLTGGSSPKGLYRLLTQEPFRSQIDWGRVEFFLGR